MRGFLAMAKPRSSVFVFTVLFYVLALSFVSSAQAVDNFPAGLKAALQKYDLAWNKKDVAGVSKILADDYKYFSSTGGITDRKKTLKFLASPDYKLTFVERTEVNLESVGARRSVAIISSRWKGRGTYGKEVINDDQRCGLVFVKENNEWKLLSEHCVQITPN
jgi:ketosteroid isomerase-like protein